MGKVWDLLARRNLELGPAAGAAPGPWRHWKLARDDNGVAWLLLDKAGASANTLSEDVLTEFNDVLANLERDLPKGLVLRSAKVAGFIAGADIGEFGGMTDAATVETKLTQANGIVDRLDRLAVPTQMGQRFGSPPVDGDPTRVELVPLQRQTGRCLAIDREGLLVIAVCVIDVPGRRRGGRRRVLRGRAAHERIRAEGQRADQGDGGHHDPCPELTGERG